jgi:hypothetical protein
MKLLIYSLITICLILLVLFIAGQLYKASQPGIMQASPVANTLLIKEDVYYLANECRYRNYENIDALNKAAAYIKERFLAISPTVSEQIFHFEKTEFKNIICSIGPANAGRIIIGAHYDVCGNQDGADDNASGVAAMLELARLLKNEPLKYRIDFIAFTNEEPPFFKSQYMGSYIHAKSLFDQHIQVKGMICLESIGYFSNQLNSQSYPAFFLKWFYGSRGNFITVVQKFGNDAFGEFVNKTMKEEQVIPTRSFKAPAWIPGVDFSDHLNYWKFGFSAVMITNTAFYRNHNYHTPNDKAGSLNMGNIGLVCEEIFRAIKKLP